MRLLLRHQRNTLSQEVGALMKAGNRDEVKRLAQSCGMIRHILALPGYRILMKHVSDEQSKRILNAYQVTGPTKRGLPAFAAYQNKHHNDPTELLGAWNVFLDIWSDPNLMDKLKASEFSEKVFLEADTEFARRIAK